MSLQNIFRDFVKVDKNTKLTYKTKIHRIVEEMVKGIRSQSRVLSLFYSKVYYTGSHWDGLEVGNMRQEGDVNVVFDPLQHDIPVCLKFREDHASPGKKNFVYVCVDLQKSRYGNDLKQLCEYSDLTGWYISPIKLFQTFVEAGKQFLDQIGNHLEVNIVTENNYRFGTTSKIGAPWTIKFHHDEFNDIEVDFVPAVLLSTDMLGEVECSDSLHSIRRRIYEGRRHETECLGISLHKADSSRFQLDFHRFEQNILEDRCFAKNVIRLLKYLRNVWKEPLNSLPSHLIKTVVMEKILLESDEYWKLNFNLEKNFTDCFELLVKRVEEGHIQDVFFPSVNLMKKIKDGQSRKFIASSLRNLWNVLAERDIALTFSGGVCLVCDQSYYRFHMLETHSWSKHTLDNLATTSTDEGEVWEALDELEEISSKSRGREFKYKCGYCLKSYTCQCRLIGHIRSNHNSGVSEKKCLCPHCLIIIQSKCKLMVHIKTSHPRFELVATMALSARHA